ncbi:MAG: ATP-binding protein, partial [Anaerolineales bacterium]
GLFNLIYGKNERGKTFLVEFLLRSLFRSARSLPLRDMDADGRLLVTGLDEEPVSFSPASNPKLEDYWQENGEGMPPNMHRLLVVKGAELAMVENEPGGLNKAILKEYLSSEAVLDTIQSKISATLESSKIEEGQIEGAKRGEIKRYRDLKADIGQIDELIDELDAVYSGGERAALEGSLEHAVTNLAAMEQAKRHQAYRLDQEIRDLEGERGAFTREGIRSLKDAYQEYDLLRRRILSNEERSAELEGKPGDYLWLKNAVIEYEKRLSAARLRGSKLFTVLEILALLGALGSLAVVALGLILSESAVAFLGMIVAILSVAGVATFSYLRGRQKDQLLRKAVDVREIDEMMKELQARFGSKQTNLAGLKAMQQELEPAYIESEGLQREKDGLQQDLIPCEARLEEMLERFGLERGEPDELAQAISEIEAQYDAVEEEIQAKREALSGLNVGPTDYVEEDPRVTYQKAKLNELLEQVAELRESVRQEDDKLNDLKQRICRETDDEISIEWEALIENLQNGRGEKVAAYKELASEILAKVLIHKELEIMREREDENIRAGLESQLVAKPLKQITGRYEVVTLRGGELVVSDPYDDFRLETLSTGAQEQVLLALRI